MRNKKITPYKKKLVVTIVKETTVGKYDDYYESYRDKSKKSNPFKRGKGVILHTCNREDLNSEEYKGCKGGN